MSPTKPRTLRLIRHYESCAEAWLYESQNYSGKDAETALSYARHLQTLAECLKLDVLEQDLRSQRWIWP